MGQGDLAIKCNFCKESVGLLINGAPIVNPCTCDGYIRTFGTEEQKKKLKLNEIKAKQQIKRGTSEERRALVLKLKEMEITFAEIASILGWIKKGK